MKKLIGLLFWFSFMLYLEMIFKIASFDHIWNINLMYSILFIVPMSIFFYLITHLFTEKINRWMSKIFIVFFTIIFMAQLIYYKTYLSIFSIYSMQNAGQLMDYWDTILKIIFRNGITMILMLLPLVLFFLFQKRYMDYHRLKWQLQVFLIAMVLITHTMSVVAILIDKNEDYSAYKLYHTTHSPTLSASKIGVLTMMRLDLKRLMFGFKEESKLASVEIIKAKVVEKKIEYNVMNIDFDTLIENDTNEILKNMDKFFQNDTGTAKNKYTGMFKGKNLITILGESFYTLAVDPVLTPTLYKLVNEGFVFENFYNPVFPVSTSDGEYMTMTGLIPKEGVWSMKRSSDKYYPFVLGNSMKEIGYKTTAYHNHTATYYYRNLSHPNFGYEYIACKRGLDINCKQWPESDLEMINATYNDYMDSTPFHTYYVTVSGHLRYNTYNSMAIKNWNAVKELPYSTPVKAYIACNIELDKALEQLIKYLDEKGILKDTVIQLSGDHYPYGLTLDEINEKMEPDRDDNFEKHRSQLVIWNSEMKPVKVEKLGSSIDVLPTLLNLFGVEYDSRLLMGKDILSDTDPVVIFSNRSWITKEGRYNAITNIFEGETTEKDYVKKINNIVYNRFYLSKSILEQDYYRHVFK